ncbi:unnamed protein product [Cylicocyclus nassatus]|uniref:Uncharacterized protein n=1 Tax=Cylicocyclus nassatus TaxID=53992 RepID=A0AA36DPM9_CYLNA|nr:unnamed protein product [Cylicocyclus nassatus]
MSMSRRNLVTGSPNAGEIHSGGIMMTLKIQHRNTKLFKEYECDLENYAANVAGGGSPPSDIIDLSYPYK